MQFSWPRWGPGLFDLAACTAAWLLAFEIRFNLQIPDVQIDIARHSLPFVVSTQFIVLCLSGVYASVWRFFSLLDIRRLFSAIFSGMVLTLTLMFFLNHLLFVPRLVWILDPLLLLGLTAGARTFFRLVRETSYDRRRLFARDAKPVVILGAGTVSLSLVRELTQSLDWTVGALLDDNVELHGKVIYGAKIMGSLDDVGVVTKKLGIRDAIIALPSATPEQRRRAVELCERAGISPMTVPAAEDLLSGRLTVNSLRNVELDDLLGRGPVKLNPEPIQKFLSNQVVLITGAGGSIGSELCRKIAEFKPKLLVFYEMNEPALYQIEQEFSQLNAKMGTLAVPFAPVIGDVKDARRLDWVMKNYRPDVVFHAAAYKHVPLMENENAWEVIRNNALGTLTAAKTAVENGVKKFVLVSTDKAVNPTNVMGATKRMAEMVCQGIQSRGREKTSFIIVRFGNVLGSNGSVIPKFKSQIALGGPITVTHPDMERFFMSIPEAAQLVLQAGSMGHGGEIFVLDMGVPIKIVDLAKLMIRLSGFSEEEIKIVFTGLRPGEKLFEELLAEGEVALATPHPKLRIAQSRIVEASWLNACEEWVNSGTIFNETEVKSKLSGFVPEYRTENSERSAIGVIPTTEAQVK